MIVFLRGNIVLFLPQYRPNLAEGQLQGIPLDVITTQLLQDKRFSGTGGKASNGILLLALYCCHGLGDSFLKINLRTAEKAEGVDASRERGKERQK